mmetsp:Transcript_67218/g.170430  ORF Transcript_67218/g.170430 Transcript_67218/m.170430 type:complete len:470 (+) Transcript_67218:48-1457(+)
MRLDRTRPTPSHALGDSGRRAAAGRWGLLSSSRQTSNLHSAIVAEGILLEHGVAQDGGLSSRHPQGDLVHFAGVLEHGLASLHYLERTPLLLVRLRELVHILEDSLQHQRHLLSLLAAPFVELRRGNCGLTYGFEQGADGRPLGIGHKHPSVLHQDWPRPNDVVAAEVRDGGPGLLRDEEACGVVGRLVRTFVGVEEAFIEPPSTVHLPSGHPEVLDRPRVHLKLRVLGAQEICDARGVFEHVLANARTDAEMQLVRAQVVVELVVAALDLLGGIQFQGIPSQFARATVHAVVFASNVHELRPSSLALDGKKQGRAVPGLPNTAGVVELHERGANGADDWPPVINEGELHAELPARTEVLRGVQRLQHPVALGRLLQLVGGAGMPEPLVHVLRRAILDETILVQEARAIHSKLRVFVQNRVILHAKDRVIRKLLHETFAHRGHQHDVRYGHLLTVLALSHALFLQQHAI